MNEQKIPEQIRAIIEAKTAELNAEKLRKEQSQREQQEAWAQAGAVLLDGTIAETLAEVVEWIRPYDVTRSTYDDKEVIEIGRRGTRRAQGQGMALQFAIPGLAPIQFYDQNKSWRFAVASRKEEWHEDYGRVEGDPEFDFDGRSFWSQDLPEVLLGAANEAAKFRGLNEQHQTDQAQAIEWAEAGVRRRADAEAKRQADEAQKAREEEQLFRGYKDDPLAMALLKAFMLIQTERDNFMSQIEQTYSEIESAEARWTRRAEDLRRQAEQAERKAEEERNRVSDLEDDLAKAEKKSKDLQRGW